MNPLITAAGRGSGRRGHMTATEKAAQLLTKRPDSYPPTHTLSHVPGLDRPDEDRWGRNIDSATDGPPISDEEHEVVRRCCA